MKRSPFGALAAGLAGAGVIVMGFAGPTFAGVHGNVAPTSTLSLVNETAPGAAPGYGQTITFKVQTSAAPEPWVSLVCDQNGTTVLSDNVGFFASYPWQWQQNVTLSSGSWTGGAANCLATLYSTTSKGKSSTLATLTFPVTA